MEKILGSDHDKSIKVSITPPTEAHCFHIDFDGTVIKLHAKSLVDLIRKCSLAYLKWQGDALAFTLKYTERDQPPA
jgi:hypothetical protein